VVKLTASNKNNALQVIDEVKTELNAKIVRSEQPKFFTATSVPLYTIAAGHYNIKVIVLLGCSLYGSNETVHPLKQLDTICDLEDQLNASLDFIMLLSSKNNLMKYF
jgi:hypothetical protein